MDGLAKEFPTDTLVNSVWLPVARASNQIKANQAAQAVSTLEAAIPYELGGPPNGAVYWPMYVRGEAYLRLHDGAKAAAEYQKILDHRGIAPSMPLYTLARLGLGRAYATARGQGQGQSGLSGLLCGLERRRPRCAYPEGSKGRIRQTAVTAVWGGHSCPPPLNLIFQHPAQVRTLRTSGTLESPADHFDLI